MKSSMAKSSAAKSSGHSSGRGRPSNEPSLADLPAAEKEKIARLAQRLISLGREHEQVRLRAEDLERQCSSLREESLRLTGEREETQRRVLTCYGLIRLYQEKLTQMVSVVEDREREVSTLEKKCRQVEEEVVRQADLIASQRNSIHSIETQLSSQSEMNEDHVKRLENEKKVITVMANEKDEKIETQRKRIAFLESTLAMKESAIVNLETDVMRLRGEVDLRTRQQETEKSAMQEVLQKTLSELDAIKSSHYTMSASSRTVKAVEERNVDNEQHGFEVDVPWDAGTPGNNKAVTKTFPLRKPAVVKRQRKRRTGQPQVISGNEEDEGCDREGKTTKDCEVKRPSAIQSREMFPPRVSGDLTLRRKENAMNGVSSKEPGGDVECKKYDVYDGRLFKLLGEIDSLGFQNR